MPIRKIVTNVTDEIITSIKAEIINIFKFRNNPSGFQIK